MYNLDFAHAPGKVKASVDGVKKQFTDKKLPAILELHTCNSLNEDFLKKYRGSLDQADIPVVFYSVEALKLKRLPLLSTDEVKEGFKKDNLMVFTVKVDLGNWINNNWDSDASVLLMSSGNYSGIDMQRSFGATVVKSP